MKKSLSLAAMLALAMIQGVAEGAAPIRAQLDVTPRPLLEYGLLDAMLELARRPPVPRVDKSTTTVDGARHCMLGIYAGKMTGGLTRYAFPPPRFDLVDGVYVDHTYAPSETT